MKPIEAAERLLQVCKEIEPLNEAFERDEFVDGVKLVGLVKQKIDLLNIITDTMRDSPVKRDSFPEYGDSQGDLMEFIYKRFDGMPIAAIVGFLEMAKLAIMDDNQ